MGKPRSKKYELQNSDPECDRYDTMLLGSILKKLTIQEQALISQKYKKVVKSLLHLWQNDYKNLELGKLQWQLRGENMHCFLNHMREHFQSIVFRSEQLQEELNILEEAGVEELPQVTSCQIAPSNKVNWEKKPHFVQWPFHALPKLLINLRSLETLTPIQSSFIDQFKKLEDLKIHEGISNSALKAIMESDLPLRKLHLFTNGLHILEGISNHSHLKDLMVNLSTFQNSRDEIIRLPNLLDLKIHETTDPEETLEAIKFVIDRNSSAIKSFKLNSGFVFNGANLKKIKLSRCCDLYEILLAHCQFDCRDMAMLNLPVSPVLAVFFDCPDLTDLQLLDFYKSCPNLKEIVLGGCPLLTEEVLHNIVKVRREENHKNFFLLKVTDCPTLSNSYKDNEKYWSQKGSYLKLESLKEGFSPENMVHFQFHKSNPKSRTAA
ncbi:hypothetical protein KR074_000803 [Drosophila pseudoananassae]|nr:hypothetical protein KR074_000803 [Drosophila pseudoananassae]